MYGDSSIVIRDTYRLVISMYIKISRVSREIRLIHLCYKTRRKISRNEINRTFIIRTGTRRYFQHSSSLSTILQRAT